MTKQVTAAFLHMREIAAYWRRSIPVLWMIATLATACFWLSFCMATFSDPNLNPWTMATNRDPWTNSCDRLERASADSPDGVWRAVSVDIACGGPLEGGAETWTAVAVVRSRHKPVNGDEVFIGDEYGKNSVSLMWQGPQSLQITLPISAAILDQKVIHQGLAVTIKFDPDDPVAREKILREQETNRADRVPG